ncbi:hypothetical protein cypCar_00028682 [Cyprinus carpio]|nr:hypothetical protein cypCar_00028682 [Cyprinus carpio]
MVAHMAHHGDTTPRSDGNGEVSPSDLKDNTSTEESSEEEEAHEEEEERDSASAEPLQSCCEKCRALKNPKFELVTPRKISRDRLQLQLDAEGVYECSDTGLVFEVSQRVKITYCVLSWSKFSTYLTGSWKFAGPIFDVDCDPSILKSVQFPHSLCLAADKDNEVKFSVLHVKNSRGLIEPSADHSGSHVRWNVSSLSPVGPIVQTSKSAEHHGVVQVFKEVGHENSFSFRVYLAGNNCSDIKQKNKSRQRRSLSQTHKKALAIERGVSIDNVIKHIYPTILTGVLRPQLNADGRGSDLTASTDHVAHALGKRSGKWCHQLLASSKAGPERGAPERSVPA